MSRHRGAELFAGDLAARFFALQFVLSAALLAGIIFSWNAWFPLTRSFPRAPLIAALPSSMLSPLEYLLSGLLVAALTALLLSRGRIKVSRAVVLLLVFLVLLDQMRLQPWVYQYLLLFVVIALDEGRASDERSKRLTLSILHLLVAALYFWSGVQKMSYSFGHEVLPQLLPPLQERLHLTGAQLTALGLSVALVEIFTGCGLLLKRTRRLAIWLAVAMHALILVLLVGRNLNSVVWAWNAGLPLIVILLFHRSDVFIGGELAGWRSRNWPNRGAIMLAFMTALLLPGLSFFGWWDSYLSGALYSGRAPVGVVRVGGEVYERLPETARRQVFTTRNGEHMLPLYEWSMSDLNLPPYPEERVYRQVARDICRKAPDKNDVELIIKERPALLDGSYSVKRMGCLQLDQ